MHIGSFEPTVMFFGMTNLPATFQAMMNEILRDLINERKIAAFVDDVLVGTKTEEGYNEIVEEILRRLEENDVTPCKRLGKISDILHLNNENNQLERRARPPKDVPLDAQSWT